MVSSKVYDFKIFGKDEQIVKAVLMKYDKRQSLDRAYNRTKMMYEFFSSDSVLELTIEEIQRFINYLEEKEACIGYKKKFIGFLKDLFHFAFISTTDQSKKTEYLNKLEQIRFLSSNVKNKSVSREKLYLSKEEIYSYLHFYEQDSSEKGLRNYIAISLMVYSGARIQAICNITPNSLSFDRFFFSVRDKLTESNYINTYYFPEPFAPLLQYYIKKMEVAPDERIFDISDKQLRKVCKKFGQEKDPRYLEIHPHSFRHLFNTHLLLGGCPEFLAESFLNQKPKTINRQHYNLLLSNRDFLVTAYHKFFPFKSFFPSFDWLKWERKYAEFL